MHLSHLSVTWTFPDLLNVSLAGRRKRDDQRPLRRGALADTAHILKAQPFAIAPSGTRAIVDLVGKVIVVVIGSVFDEHVGAIKLLGE
jgi:hypothetical protein